MKEILEQLNKTKGIIGSLVVARDGIVIASQISDDLDPDAVGAAAGAIGSAVGTALMRTRQGMLENLTLDATAGKLFLANASDGYLVAIARQDANAGLVRLELMAAAQRLNGSNGGDEQEG